MPPTADREGSAGAAAARGFELSALPAEFYDDPYPYYAGLRENDPVSVRRDGTVFVVESAAHRLSRLAPGALAAAGVVDGERHRTERPPSPLARRPPRRGRAISMI